MRGGRGHPGLVEWLVRSPHGNMDQRRASRLKAKWWQKQVVELEDGSSWGKTETGTLRQLRPHQTVEQA